MKRNIRIAVALCASVGGLIGTGCNTGPSLQQRFQNNSNNLSWPERYSYQAREPVLYAFEAQANNAAAVDGIMNNSFFEAGTDKLNGVGAAKLDQLGRVMPMPNPTIYLQTAADVAFDSANLGRTATQRNELNQKRAQAVLAYANSRPNTRGTQYEVVVLDIADPSNNSAGPANSVRGLAELYQSGITGSFGGTLPGAGGGQATGTIGVQPNANPGGGAVGPGGGNVGGTGR